MKDVSWQYSKQRRNSTQNGLSLIELLMVLAIMGILMGIGGLGLIKNLPEYRLKSAAREMMSSMQKAKIEAIKKNIKCRIVFDINQEKYYICTDKGSDGSWSSIGDNTIIYTVDLSQDNNGIGFGYGSADFDATVNNGDFSSESDSVSYTYNGVTFNARGTCSCGYVYLDNQKNNTYAIGTLNTGGIVLKKWNGSQWVDE